MTNFRQVRKSGYLTRKLSLAMVDNYHDHSLKDCGTTHTVLYFVKNDDRLKQINGRHFYDLTEKEAITTKNRMNEESYTKGTELKTVSYTRDKELIGKVIAIRSPITCASEKVCATCYGRELSEINKDKNTGIVAVLRLTEPLTQKLLSAKHLLTTNTDEVKWGETFSDIFNVDMNEIYFNGVDTKISFTVDPEQHDAMDDDALYITAINIDKKKYVTPKDSASNDDEDDQNRIRLYINKTILDNDDLYEIDEESRKMIFNLDSMDFSTDQPIFYFNARNNELSKSLQQILDLIESSGHLGITDYHKFANKFNDLVIENGLSISSVHLEMITRELIRDVHTGGYVDFKKKEIDSYEIIRVSNAILRGPLSKSLSFERLNDQFLSLDTYTKDGESYMDYLFK